MFKDTETYEIIKRDPCKKLITSLRKFIRWKNKNYINAAQYKLYCSDGILPRAYALSKIHKIVQNYSFIN